MDPDQQAQSATADQDQQAPTTDPTPASAPTAGDGPWAQDLAQLFPDEEVRSTVDQFLRAKVQPYTTTLEQRTAQAKDALNLWESLSTDPIDTYVQMTTEMWGDEAGQAMLAHLQNLQSQQTPEENAAMEETIQQQGMQIDPRLEAAAEWVERQQAEQEYAAEIARIKQAEPELDEELFAGEVVIAEGNFERALDLYHAKVARFRERFGAAPTPPPATSGSDAGAAVPSSTVTPQAQTMEDAFANFFAMQDAARGGAPPVM